MKFSQIGLALIEPSKMNPRKHGAVATAKDLALIASVKAKGVIEPIIVRPKDKKISGYEIVAGERRYRAAFAAGLEFIPAVVRDLTDDQAYDFMLIENLQREDLTALEEAESFRAYVGRHGKGKDAIRDLAEKTAIDPRYIRTRIEALNLPRPALAAWEKGEISFGHLEQFLRLPGPTEVVKKLAEVKRDRMSVAQLRHEIGEWALSLGKARFDVGKECARCRQNSVVQQDLFGIGDTKGMCLNPKCFKMKQTEWLTANWTETPEAKKYRTKGARFEADVLWQSKKGFYGQRGIAKKCLGCDNFVSLVKTDGTVDDAYSDGTVCIGDRRCFESAGKAAAAAERTATRDERAKAVESGGRERIAWHGTYFRNLFFRKRIPEVLAGLKPDDEKTKTLLAMCLAHESTPAREAMGKPLGFKSDSVGEEKLFKALLRAPYKMIAPIFGKMVEAVINEGVDAYQFCAFDTDNRRLAAEFLGIDLVKEWAADEEYMAKKTRKELLAFGRTSGILKDGKAKAYILGVLKKKSPDPERLKKSELVDVFLKSGVPLVGAVPAEILKDAKP
jgi:ParB family chromosome partitioning protein